MPKPTKDSNKNELNKKRSTTKKATSTIKKNVKTSTSKTKKETISVDKKEVKEKSTKTTSKKTTSGAKKKSSSIKKTSTTTEKKIAIKAKKVEPNVVAEYYDLPYRYNETIVRILYQTPTILFVYWDISDLDKENYIKQYGENFFNNTKPILKIFNLTKKYDFEVEINDYANSWYINVNDADCEYNVELIRRTIKYEENLNTEYIHVSSSNDIESPNDRILLDELPNNINFKNVKTNLTTVRDIGTIHLVGINKIYNIHDFYKKFYKDEILEEINSNIIINPSSSSWN